MPVSAPEIASATFVPDDVKFSNKGRNTMTIEFIFTSLIVVLLPGTGVIYTVSTGLTQGGRASIYAAAGCTAGIVPHLCASIFGVAAILHTSGLAFQIFKIIGVLYLGYLAWAMWQELSLIHI